MLRTLINFGIFTAGLLNYNVGHFHTALWTYRW